MQVTTELLMWTAGGTVGTVTALVGWIFVLVNNHHREAREDLQQLWEKEIEPLKERLDEAEEYMNDHKERIGHRTTRKEVSEIVQQELQPLNRTIEHMSDELRRNTEAVSRLTEAVSEQKGREQGRQVR